MFNIKKIIKWFFVILGLLLCLFIVFIVLIDPNKLPKEEIPILKETKADIKKEWKETDHRGITQSMIEVHYSFDGLNEVGYYQQQLANKDKISSFQLMTFQDRLKTQKEPSNLANYIKDRHPFDRWNKRGVTYDMTTANGFKHSRFDKAIDSQLYLYVRLEKQFKEDSGGNCLIVKYKGPKHFLEDDKDYYLGCTWVENSEFKNEDFRLHFNPVRKTLSIYQDKHNNDKTQEAAYNKKTSDDW